MAARKGRGGRSGGGRDFIAPEITELAERLKREPAGTGDAETRWRARCRPFLGSPSVDTLAELLRRHRDLYWHPDVKDLIAQLVVLCQDRQEWEKRGWCESVEDDGTAWPPPETQRARDALALLLDAHVGALLPEKAVLPRPLATKRGPKAQLRNPHPVSESWRSIDRRTLASSHADLARGLTRAARDLVARPGEAIGDAKARVEKVLRAALGDAGPMWSALCEVRVDADPPAGFAELAAKDRRSWKLANLVEHWNVDLAPIVNLLVTRRPLPVRKSEGRPRDVAYALLGALLDVPATKVRDLLSR